MQDTKLLVVDDNPTSLKLMESFLDVCGYSARFLDDSNKVIETLRQDPVNLLLMDVAMPDLSGIEVCRLMQKDPELSTIPIIFITGQRDEETMAEAFEAGGSDFLTKPFVFTELLSRIQTQLRLRSSERHLRQQLAQRELLLTSLAHDLRSPIGTSAVMLRHLLDREDNLEASRHMISTLADSLQRTYALLEDMLSWAQAVSGDIPFTPSPTGLSDLFQSCLEHHRRTAESKQITIEIENGSGEVVYIDHKLVRTILLNLIGNALKFTPSGGCVRLAFQRHAEQIELSVCDSGKGMSEELLEHIQRNHPIVSQPGTQGEKGTGMGLKLCQEFARSHGGEINISSKLGVGSCFKLLLPQGSGGS